MRLPPDQITSLMSEGYVTLQVPDHVIAFGTPPEYEEYPDEWFMRLGGKNVTLPGPNGYLYLSRQGWEANRERIRAAFTAVPASRRRGTWADFEAYVVEHFASVAIAIGKEIASLEAKIARLQAARERV